MTTTNTAETTGPPAGARPRDWLELLRRARVHGATLEPMRRARLAKLRPLANAADLRAQARGDPALEALSDELRMRANDLEYARAARPAIVTALVERDGGALAVAARLAPGFAARWPYITHLGVARRDVPEVARRLQAERGGSLPDRLVEARQDAGIDRLEAEQAAWSEAQALALVDRAMAGDVQALFRVWPQDLARELAGPLPAWCAYLVDVEDHPDD
jgi:hypothetical protein